MLSSLTDPPRDDALTATKPGDRRLAGSCAHQIIAVSASRFAILPRPAHRGHMNQSYDVVVVGGGAAGLAGAVALARSRRSVLVIDSGEPRNAPASHVHNFLSRDGTPPAQLYTAGREEVTRYGGTVVTGRVTALSRDGDHFLVQLDRRAVTTRRLLVATGLRDELPEVPGLAARWGIDVLHCPYCHGWEVRDQRIGILATGQAAAHQALLFRQLSPNVTVLRHTGPEVSPDQQGQVIGTQIEAGPTGATGVPGVWVAGNIASMQAQVISAAAAGLTAGAAINADLAAADARGAAGLRYRTKAASLTRS